MLRQNLLALNALVLNSGADMTPIMDFTGQFNSTPFAQVHGGHGHGAQRDQRGGRLPDQEGPNLYLLVRTSIAIDHQ